MAMNMLGQNNLELDLIQNRIKVTDLLGKVTKQTNQPTNQPLFYIYDDGTVENSYRINEKTTTSFQLFR